MLLNSLLDQRPNKYQTIRIDDNTILPGTHDTLKIWGRLGIPKNLIGKTLLDIGCSTGAYLLEALYHGADLVTGIDEAVDCCSWADNILNYQLRYTSEKPFSIIPGRFDSSIAVFPHDYVLALSVIHHQRRPLEFLRLLRSVTKHTLWIEWELWDEHAPAKLDIVPEELPPPISTSSWGLGYYPTEYAAINAIIASGFSEITPLGKVRDRSCGENRMAFECHP